MVRESDVKDAEIWPVHLLSSRLRFFRSVCFFLQGQFVGEKEEHHTGNGPCKAGDEAAGSSAKASKSLLTAEDCFNAVLKREF